MDAGDERNAAAAANDTATVLACRVEIGKLTAHIRRLQQERQRQEVQG